MKIQDYNDLFAMTVMNSFEPLVSSYGYHLESGVFKDKTRTFCHYSNNKLKICLNFNAKDELFDFSVCKLNERRDIIDSFLIIDLIYFFNPELKNSNLHFTNLFFFEKEKFEQKIILQAEKLFSLGDRILKGEEWFNSGERKVETFHRKSSSSRYT